MRRKIWNLIYYGFAIYLPKSNFPVFGKFSKWLRNKCAHRMFAVCLDDVNLETGAYIGSGKSIYTYGKCGIGKNFKCHNFSIIIKGCLLMGEDVLFQGGVHDFSNPDLRIGANQTRHKSRIEIEDDVWIGARAIILNGCNHIGSHSIIGAGAVVTKDVPDYSIMAGNPARVVKFRKITL